MNRKETIKKIKSAWKKQDKLIVKIRRQISQNLDDLDERELSEVYRNEKDTLAGLKSFVGVRQ